MPVRGVFLVIGTVAIVGILGAVVVRQAASHTDDLASFNLPAGASAAVASMLVPTSAGAATTLPAVADDVFGANRIAPLAQVQVQGGPPVSLPGGTGQQGQATSGQGTGAQGGSQMPPALTGIQLPGSQQQAQPAAQPAAVQPAAGGQPAAAQPNAAAGTPNAQGNAGGTADGTALAGQATVDETALRYFARQGDTRRLNAEIARLRSLYPNWYPPADMTAPIPVTDTLLDNMWRLYSTGDYPAVRAAIASRMANDATWKPPADLLTRLDVGESRDRLINASNAKQYDTVVQIAAATPSLLTCADVDVLWRVAEAFARTDRPGRARDVNVYVLTNCQDAKERLATLQKAMGYSNDAELGDLLALERTGADGRGEFAPVRGDIARRRVGTAAKDSSRSAPPEDLALLGDLAKGSNKPDDAVLLASYLFTHNDAEGSANWWQLAKTRADTPQIARGLAYALNAISKPADAEAAAYRWRESSPENKEVYLTVASALLSLDPPAKIDPEVMTRMAKVIGDAKFAQGAQELGWYAYNTGQTLAAARWFSAALTWKADLEPAAFGLALATQKLGDRLALAQILRVWAPRSQRIADLADPNRQKAAAVRSQTFELPPSIAAPGTVREVVPAAAATPAPDQGAAIGVQGSTTGIYAPAPVASVVSTTVPVASAATIAPVGQGVVQAPAVLAPVPSAAAVVAEAPVARTVAPRRSGGGGGGGGGGDCRGTVPADSLRGSAALNRGWCLMGFNRPLEASDAFAAAMNSTTGRARQDAAYGKSLADLRAGLTDSAAIAASSAPQTTKRATELQTAIVTQRALAAYQDDRWIEALQMLDVRSQLAPEQKDLMLVRAWSYYHLGRVRDAKRIFSALAKTGSRDAAKALAGLSTYNQSLYDTDDLNRR